MKLYCKPSVISLSQFIDKNNSASNSLSVSRTHTYMTLDYFNLVLLTKQ